MSDGPIQDQLIQLFEIADGHISRLAAPPEDRIPDMPDAAAILRLRKAMQSFIVELVTIRMTSADLLTPLETQRLTLVFKCEYHQQHPDAGIQAFELLPAIEGYLWIVCPQADLRAEADSAWWVVRDRLKRLYNELEILLDQSDELYLV